MENEPRTGGAQKDLKTASLLTTSVEPGAMEAVGPTTTPSDEGKRLPTTAPLAKSGLVVTTSIGGDSVLREGIAVKADKKSH